MPRWPIFMLKSSLRSCWPAQRLQSLCGHHSGPSSAALFKPVSWTTSCTPRPSPLWSVKQIQSSKSYYYLVWKREMWQLWRLIFHSWICSMVFDSGAVQRQKLVRKKLQSKAGYLSVWSALLASHSQYQWQTQPVVIIKVYSAKSCLEGLF